MGKRIIFFVVSCFVLISCNGSSNVAPTGNSDSGAENMQFLSSKAVCRTLIQRLCLQTQDNELFSDPIEGFEFNWGHTYELSLEVSEIENPPLDASSQRYELTDIVSDTEDSTGTRYEYERVNLLDSTFTNESDVYYFLGQPFTCGVDVDCVGLVSINNSGGSVNVSFEYIGNGEISLVQWN